MADITYEYSDSDVAGRKNVDIQIDSSIPYISGVTAYTNTAGANPSQAAVTEVQNSTVTILGGSGTYVTGADAYNMGAVHGTRTLNMVDGSTYGLIGGLILNDTIEESYTPVKSDADVVINMTGGQVTRINGGAFFSVSKVKDADGNVTAMSTAQYIESKGGLSAFAVGGDVYINVLGNGVVREELFGGGSYSSVDGKVTIVFGENSKFGTNNYNAEDCCIFGGAKRGAYVGSSEIIIKDSADINGRIYGGGAASSSGTAIVNGDTKVSILGGIVRDSVFGGGQKDIVHGSTNVNIAGGTVTGNVYGGGSGSTIEGGTNVTLTGGSVEGAVYGTGVNDTVKGDVTISILGGDWSDTDIVALAEGAKLEGGNAYLYVGSDEQAYDGSVKSFEGFNHLVVHKNSTFDMSGANVFGISNQTITLSAINLQKAAVTGAYAEVGAEGVTLTLLSEGRLRSGKYLVAAVDSLSKNRAARANVPSGWTLDNVTVNGIATFDDLEWIGNTLYLNYLSSGVEAAALSNWGVFKSSQAFVNALWNQRGENAVSLDANDGKGGISPATRNMAWAAVYGMDGRISDAADYNTYGVAVGAERKFGKSSSVGLALGYGWGEVSPFATGKVDQESAYLAMYGCAGAWNMYKGSLSVDWSVAVGDTTSESKEYSGDWSQTSWQLDARATYSQAISERTTASAFVGVQYYTHDSAEVDGVSISGMDNLRLFVGGGLNRRVSERASVYGEASVFADVLRDNPYAVEAGQRYEGNNPGRVGGKVGVGASYSISDKWSARGGYSFEVADDNTEHNLNLGASYSF